MYAIKVYLNKPKSDALDSQKNYYLMRDLEDHVVHVFTRKARAETLAKALQEENPRMLITITQDIPTLALARAVAKRQDNDKEDENQKPDSKDG